MSAVAVAPASTRTFRTAAAVVGRFVLRFGLLALLCWIWQRATAAAANPYFPTPLEILDKVRTLWFAGPASHLWTSAPLWTDVAPSLVRMLAGWLGGSLIGAAIGVSAGAFPTVRRMVDPAAQFLRALPTPAILPVFLIVFGANDVMRVLVIAFGCTWPVLLNAMQATGAIDPVARDTARTLRLGLLRRLLKVDLCYATPAIFAGMRVGLALALVLMVLSEWVVATSGLGFFLVDSQRHFEFAGMWAAMVALGVLGYVFNTVFTALERRALRWHRHSRARHD